jgi:phosphotransferase system, enzyme I, PtsP
VLELIQSPRVRVHEHLEGGLGGVLRLIERVASSAVTEQELGALCEEVSALMQAPVVSVYVRGTGSESDVLCMRANVGLPEGVAGTVRLRVGEGITGFAAECLRPVSVDAGPAHDRYKPVPGIGEEAFPCYLAVPLVQGGQALGVMVLQRSAHEPFDEGQVMLATALAAPFAHALDLARAGRRPVRDALVVGEGMVEGVAMGRARPLPTMDSLLSPSPTPAGSPLALRARTPPPIWPCDLPDGADVGVALSAVCTDLQRAARKAAPGLPPDAASALAALLTITADQRLREHMGRACAERGARCGLEAVARAYARVPYRAGALDPEAAEWLAERAQDVDDLCLLVAARLAGRPLCRAGEVLWVGGRLGAFLALAALARRASAVVVANPVAMDGLAAKLLESARTPTVAAVPSLFEWARADDRLVVDGGTGHVRVNPAPRRVASLRGRGTSRASSRR